MESDEWAAGWWMDGWINENDGLVCMRRLMDGFDGRMVDGWNAVWMVYG